MNAITELTIAKTTSVKANPYIRNKEAIKYSTWKEIEDLDIELHPKDFYNKYVKPRDRITLIFVFVLSVILGLLVVYFPEIFPP